MLYVRSKEQRAATLAIRQLAHSSLVGASRILYLPYFKTRVVGSRYNALASVSLVAQRIYTQRKLDSSFCYFATIYGNH